MLRLIISLAVLFVIPAQGAAAEIVGRASVIDGDTIEIRGQRIRLFGIDAPEGRQLCQMGDRSYRCGQKAALALADFIGAKTVRTDRYRRTIATCFVNDRDLGAWLVREGWALAFRRYSLDYVSDENGARVAKRGVWRGDFEMPWEWRGAHPRQGTGGYRE
jgi:endonuclease YncB( thermonuclease family)